MTAIDQDSTLSNLTHGDSMTTTHSPETPCDRIPDTLRSVTLDPHVFAAARRELFWFYAKMGGAVPAVCDAPGPDVWAASRIAGWLRELLPNERGTFVVRYDGRRWPARLARQFGGLTSLVVRIGAMDRPRGPTETVVEAEQTVATGLMALIAAAKILSAADSALDPAQILEHTRSRARARLGAAERAYVEARGDSPCVVPTRIRAGGARGGRATNARPTPTPAPTFASLVPAPEIEDELSEFFGSQDEDEPPSNFERAFSTTVGDSEWRCPEEHARAERRHRVVGSHLKSMSDHDAGVLQCAYLPRPWPALLAQELGRLTGVMVRLSCDRASWPEARSRQLAIDGANAHGLFRRVQEGGDLNRRFVRDLRRQAQAEFAKALAAYVRARDAHTVGGSS